MSLKVNCAASATKSPKIVLGVSFNHLYMLRTMLKHGVKIPDVLLSDSVVMFKVMVSKTESAKLSYLGDKYVHWVEHTLHDADCGAKVLMAVMNKVYNNPSKYFAKFLIGCNKYMSLVGLDKYQRMKAMEQRIRESVD